MPAFSHLVCPQLSCWNIDPFFWGRRACSEKLMEKRQIQSETWSNHLWKSLRHVYDAWQSVLVTKQAQLPPAAAVGCSNTTVIAAQWYHHPHGHSHSKAALGYSLSCWLSLHVSNSLIAWWASKIQVPTKLRCVYLQAKMPVILGKEGQTHSNNAVLKAGNLRLSPVFGGSVSQLLFLVCK